MASSGPSCMPLLTICRCKELRCGAVGRRKGEWRSANRSAAAQVNGVPPVGRSACGLRCRDPSRGLRPTGQGADDVIVLRLLRLLRFLLRRPTVQVAMLRMRSAKSSRTRLVSSAERSSLPWLASCGPELLGSRKAVHSPQGGRKDDHEDPAGSAVLAPRLGTAKRTQTSVALDRTRLG
jgi:hypothetical protein